MKIHFIAVMAAILITGSVTAQNINIGIKGGVNLYNVNTEGGESYDTKAGIHLGFLGHIHLAEQLGLQPELVFSSQGTKFSSGGTDANLNLSYVNVPLLFQYMFDNGFRIQAGPQLGFLVGAKVKVGSAEDDVKDDFKGTDFGLGLGMSYVNPSSGFGVDARYNLGLSNINEDSSITTTNRGIQIGVFYLFNHKS